MDSEWLAAANAAVSACAEEPSLQGALLDARALEPGDPSSPFLPPIPIHSPPPSRLTAPC